MAKEQWSKESQLYGEGRKIPGNPVCARCGQDNLTIAILTIAGGGQEVTYCPSCLVFILTSAGMKPADSATLARWKVDK